MKRDLIVMTDEARAAVRFNGPTDKQLLFALLDNHVETLPSERHLRWMAAEILKARGWKIEDGYVGKSAIKNGILLSPGTISDARISIGDATLAAEALNG
jgi:hypothetical protein